MFHRVKNPFHSTSAFTYHYHHYHHHHHRCHHFYCRRQHHVHCHHTKPIVVIFRDALSVLTKIQNPRQKDLIFTDALSVLNKLPNPRQKDLIEVETALVYLAAQTHLTLQWIPAHCRIQGNEQAHQLVRERGPLDQEDRYISYTDEKTIFKTLSKKKWKQQRLYFSQSDSLHRLNRPEQVILAENWAQQTKCPHVQQVQGW